MLIDISKIFSWRLFKRTRATSFGSHWRQSFLIHWWLMHIRTLLFSGSSYFMSCISHQLIFFYFSAIHRLHNLFSLSLFTQIESLLICWSLLFYCIYLVLQGLNAEERNALSLRLKFVSHWVKRRRTMLSLTHYEFHRFWSP